jgi:hypothetical protein
MKPRSCASGLFFVGLKFPARRRSLVGVTAMMLALVGFLVEPGGVDAARRAWKLEQPHCGMPLYDYMTEKQRDELCEINRSTAARVKKSSDKIRALARAEGYRR